MRGILIVLYVILAGTMEVLPVADGKAIPASQLGTFDITIANILAGPIVRLQPVFASFTKPGTPCMQLVIGSYRSNLLAVYCYFSPRLHHLKQYTKLHRVRLQTAKSLVIRRLRRVELFYNQILEASWVRCTMCLVRVFNFAMTRHVGR